MTKICVLGCHNHMQRLVNRDDIEFYELYDPDPFNITIPQWGQEYTNFINSINPDYVICIVIRCAAVQCNNWIKTCKKSNRKFIMWNFDSYRHHTVEHNNADLYFYCLDDAVKKEGDLFLPVYAQPRPVVDLFKRKFNFGIVCHFWGLWRDRELPKVAKYMDILTEVPAKIYYQTISQIKCGLNMSSHPDGLPNMRSFEYPSCGVWQVCSNINKNILEKLFDNGISYYNDINEIPNILRSLKPYDPYKLREHIAKNHTLLHRIKEIMNHFDVNIRLIPEDEHIWTWEDYQQRHNK